MGDVSVGDPAPAIQANVLMEILGSSESVQARIKAFQDAKAAAEYALEQLRIGKDAVASYAQAEERNTRANELLAKAQADADTGLARLGEASRKAADILADADEKAASVEAELAAKKAAHEQWVADAQANLVAKQVALDVELKNAQAKTAAAQAATDAAYAAQKSAEDAQAKSEAAEADFKSKGEKLQAALADITGK